MRPTTDVVVVGYGPVGATLAVLLAQAGLNVTVLERHAAPYPLPRAVRFDDEVARVFALCGIADRFSEFGDPGDQYDWQTADGRTLLHFDFAGPGPSGWPRSTMFYQPGLERALSDRAAGLPDLTVLRGQHVETLVQDDDRVTVRATGPDGTTEVSARWVVGCDGAASTVRGLTGLTVEDLGFYYDWLICDVVLDPPREFEPSDLQICDPARPTTQVSGGPGRRRWEFMRLPGETVEDLSRPEVAWRLLAPYGVTPDVARLERAVVYTFQAWWASSWRSDRVFLAGDAAHLMPPFAGEGMCSGVRDAVNLAWKLAAVERGGADPALLDSYSSERIHHVRHAMMLSIELGKVICLDDAEAAAARDEAMLAHGGDPAEVLPPLPPAMLGPGAWTRGGGDLWPQFPVRVEGRSGRFDELMGAGDAWLLLAGTPDTDTGGTALDDALLGRLGIRRASVHEFDAEGRYAEAMRERGAHGVLVRPDFWVFGTAGSPAEVAALVSGYAQVLGVEPPGQ